MGIQAVSKIFGDLSLMFTGREQCKPKHHYSVEYSEQYLLHYITDGEGIFRVNGKEYKLKCGNAFLIGKKLGYYEADSVNPWTYIWVNFSGEIAECFLKEVNLSEDSPVYRTENPDAVTKCFEALLQCGCENRFNVLGKFFELFGEMVNSNAVKLPLPKSTSEYVSVCKEFIHANYYTAISMKQLCSLVGLEYSYLYRLFVAEEGISPGNYAINYKLARAAYFLETSNMTVEQAATAVGYTDRVAFSRLFSRKYGMPPQQYRKLRG